MTNVLTVRSRGITALGPLHEAFARLRGWPAIGVAALLGAFCLFAFAPFHVTAILMLGLSGLVWMIDGARGQRRWGRAVFARGWAFGFGYFLVSLHWTAAPFLVEPEKHAAFLWMPLILLPGGMALLWGAAAAMAAAFWSSSPSRVFVFAAFLAFAEWTRGHLFGGFPWNLPGTSWLPGGAVSQLASIGGVYWLTLLTVFACAAPAALVDTREDRALGLRLAPTLAAVIGLSLAWAWGGQRLSVPPVASGTNVVLMDSGVPQHEKWQPENRANVLRRYVDMLNTVKSAPGDVVIWPEGAMPFALLSSTDAMDAISVYLGERHLIVGTSRWQSNGGADGLWFNALAVLNAGSNRSGPVALYDKHRLVPVGELPVARIIPFGEAISGVLPSALQRMARSGFEPGPGPAIVYAEGVPPFVPMICYEGLYPEIPRAVKPRADWLVVISNDAWFGALIGPAQHYAQNRYRAIETGLPMARVASRGASAVTDGRGREIARSVPVGGDLPGWNARAVRSALPKYEAQTLHSRYGSAFFWISLALFAAMALVAWRR